MKPIKTTHCNSFHEMGETIAAEFLIENTALHKTLRFELREKPNQISSWWLPKVLWVEL
jgi:hypothetical protein